MKKIKPGGGTWPAVLWLLPLLAVGPASGCSARLALGPAAGHAGATVERGIASWYGPGFYGRPTASGETYTGRELTAAHRTLPFGTVVRVTRLDNRRAVEVRINDRGPFVRGRIIDLSTRAGRQIGLDVDGITRVEVRVLR